MNSLLYFFALIAIICSSPVVRSPAENERNARIIMENSRINFPCGWPDIGEGIPPLEPFFINEWRVYQNQNGINTVTALSGVRLFGLKNFVIEKFTIYDDRRVEYIFKVAQMYMNGTHSTQGTMIGIPVVNGNGPMVAHMTNSRYFGTITWSTYPGTEYMYVSGHNVITEIESMNMTLTGFGVLDGAVNSQINDQLPEMIAGEDFQQQMNDMFSSFVVPVVDSFIYMETPETIVDVLAHYAANPRPPQC